MLTLQQIDKHFNTAQVILFLGIAGIFLGGIINNQLVMNISLGIELLVGLLFLIPLLTALIQTQIEIAQTILHHYHVTNNIDEKSDE